LVATSRSVTLAPETAAFCGSVTWPETVPVDVDCALARGAPGLRKIANPTISSPKESEDKPALLSLRRRVPAANSLESLFFIVPSIKSFEMRAR
jgi:hypothetical protein